MYKHNSSLKKLKKQYVSINDSIESYFDRLKLFIRKVKKSGFDPNHRVFLIVGSIVILTIGYFILPSAYDKNVIKDEIKRQVLDNYNINLKFNQKINYGLLPFPHFSSKNVLIENNQNEIANIKNFKVFIHTNKFFAFNEVKIKDLLIKKADFNINKNDLEFFKNLLISTYEDNKIIIENSDIFFKNINDELLFINKIKDIKFTYDKKKSLNVLNSKNEIFNIPFKLKLNLDKFTKKITTKFNSNKIRVNIENKITYKNEVIVGLLEILLINKNILLDYQIHKNSLIFSSQDSENSFEGHIDFKPFYLVANLNYERINTKSVFRDSSILVDLIKSEIFNNRNLNLNINFNIRDVIDNDQLNNLLLKVIIQEGILNFSNSNIMWKNSLKINLDESELNFNEEQMNLIGRVKVDFKDTYDFYSFFQIKRNFRKKIDQIEFDFIYNFNSKEINFDNIKVDNLSNENLDKFINEFNVRENRVFNKITFKNFINDFFSSYAG